MNRHPVTPAMRRVAPRAWPAIVAAAMFSLAASSVLALDGDELLRKVDRNLNPESYEMYRKLINIEPDGRRKEFVLYTVKKGRDKMIVLFLKFAKLELFRRRHDDAPLFLLDDVDAELDLEILQSLLSRLPVSTQVFATSAKEAFLAALEAGPHRRLSLENGRVTSARDFA